MDNFRGEVTDISAKKEPLVMALTIAAGKLDVSRTALVRGHFGWCGGLVSSKG